MACLGPEEKAPWNDELHSGEVKFASRVAMLPEILGVGVGVERDGPKNALSLLAHGSGGWDCVCIPTCEFSGYLGSVYHNRNSANVRRKQRDMRPFPTRDGVSGKYRLTYCATDPFEP